MSGGVEEKFTMSAIKKEKETCVLCGELYSLKNEFGCCDVCRLVQVKLKDIKPAILAIQAMLHKHAETRNKREKEEKIVTELKVQDALAMPHADPADGRLIPLDTNSHIRINVACSFYPHNVDRNKISAALLDQYFNVELSILFKYTGQAHSKTVNCVACRAAVLVTEENAVSQSLLESHVSNVHVPNSTARDYRFVCVLCNEVVYTTYEARNHLHDKHPSLEEEAFTINGLLDYTCSVCEQVSRQSNQRSRLGSEIPQFSSVDQLQLHLSVVHPGKFVCGICKHTPVMNSLEMLELHTQAYHPEVG